MAGKVIMAILKDTLLEMIVSVVLLIVAAFIVFKISPSAMTIKIMVIAIYGISSFVGGYILGKVMSRRKFLWGMVAGAVYFGVIILASFVIKGGIGAGTVSVLTGFVTSVVAGTIGGMIS